MKSRVPGEALKAAPGRRVGKGGARKAASTEQRFRRLFESAPDGILILEGENHWVLEANPFVLKLLGRAKKDVIGKRLDELDLIETESAERSFAEQLHRAGSVRFERELVDAKSGQIRELECICNLYEEDGRQLIQCNIRDLEQRMHAEQRLRDVLQQLAAAKAELENRVQDRTADLQQRNAELEAFSYSLSHDLRAPIRAIVSFTQIALEDFGPVLGRKGAELLERAISAAQRLDRLILDVLSFSKTTRQQVTHENVDVRQLLLDILRERPEWTSPHAQLKIEEPLLPVRGDRASLTQCLTNLLDNAVKFVPRGKVPIVRVYSQAVGTRVRLAVEDNGLGIPTDAQPRVFDLFQRAHNGFEGHGIGLAIVRRAAERMGGTVGLTSVPGKGSTFWVELPAAV